MVDEYLRVIEKDIKKYYKTYFEYDYEKIIEICIKVYDEFKSQNPTYEDDYEFRKVVYYFILNLSFNLDKENFNKYIKCLKQYKFYKIKSRYRFFPRLELYYYMLQEGKFYRLKNKSTQKKIQYYFNKYDKFPIKLKKMFCNYLLIDYIELVITTKCTLNCKACANLMCKYEKPYNVDLKTIKNSIDKLLECCDEIKTFRILGGEPFCNTNLKEILTYLESSKIRNVVIVTNGTIIPRDKELINILKNDKFSIKISDYDELSSKKDKLIDFCKKNNITCEYGKIIRMWHDYGELKKYKNDVKKQFFYCNNNCKSILNGKIYYCPRQAHGIDLGIINATEDEYINLLENSKEENKKILKKYLFRNEPISACNYCKYATTKSDIIPVAEQLKRGKNE